MQFFNYKLLKMFNLWLSEQLFFGTKFWARHSLWCWCEFLLYEKYIGKKNGWKQIPNNFTGYLIIVEDNRGPPQKKGRTESLPNMEDQPMPVCNQPSTSSSRQTTLSNNLPTPPPYLPCELNWYLCYINAT